MFREQVLVLKWKTMRKLSGLMARGIEGEERTHPEIRDESGDQPGDRVELSPEEQISLMLIVFLENRADSELGTLAGTKVPEQNPVGDSGDGKRGEQGTLGVLGGAGQGGQWGASTYRDLGGAPSQLVSRPPNWQLPRCPPRHQGGGEEITNAVFYHWTENWL